MKKIDGRVYSTLEEERERLIELERLELVNTLPEQSFDRLTRMVSTIFDMPIALISLLTSDRQFFKSCVGLSEELLADGTDREDSFCQYVVAHKEPLVVTNVFEDERFKDNRFVAGQEGIRFYAGAPLFTSNGYVLGTLCVIDTKAREFTDKDMELLVDFSEMVMDEIALRDSMKQIKRIERHLKDIEERYRSVVESVKEVIFQMDEKGRWVFLNPAWEEITGYTVEETLGCSYRDHIHPVDLVHSVQTIRSKIAEHESSYLTELQFGTKQKGYRWLEISSRIAYKGENFHGISGTIVDITERKESALALLALKEEAIEANRSKSEFLSRMSHELRTPMNAILGFAQLLEASELSNVQKGDTREIIKAGQHLIQLINEVLDLAKVEAGKINLSIEEFEVGPIVEECIALMLPLIVERNIQMLQPEPAVASLLIKADKMRFKQVLLNLLSNAVKYNVAGGSVHIYHEYLEEARVRIHIKDSGGGIPEEELPHLFDPFYRIKKDIPVEGSGIGLTIAKQLIEVMDGRIGVHSSPEEGTTFWIEFQAGLKPELTLQKLNPQGGIPSSESNSGMKTYTILYIEDNQANCLLVQRILSTQPSLNLITTPYGAEGIKLACTHHPDLILLDIHLPDMSGNEVISVLQESLVTRNIPVVAVSANALPNDIEATLALGFEDYVVKPIMVEQFVQTILRILKK